MSGGYPENYTDPPWDGSEREFAEVVLPARMEAVRTALDGVLADLGFPELHFTFEPTAAFTCPRCGRTSHNPDDLREGYCGACHDWTGVPQP